MRPTRCFCAVVLNTKTHDLYEIPEIRAHDPGHAIRLAEKRIQRKLPHVSHRAIRVWKVWRGTLREAR